MTNHEQQRLRLRADLIRAIGEVSTDTLMSSVPPFDWSQVATKQDLDPLATHADVTYLESRLTSQIHLEVLKSTRWIIGVLIATLIAITGAVIGIR